MNHVLSANEFSRKQIEELCARAAEFKTNPPKELHKGKIAILLFYEPSTRTDLSFWTAATRLGMNARTVQNAREFSSAAKGERPEHTGRVVSGYADVIIVRHHEDGGIERIAKGSKVPVINAGDGGNEHPTQTLLDCFTIREQLGHLDDLHVVLAGDLRYGRTTRSLAVALSNFKNITLTLVAPKELEMKEDIVTNLKAKNIRINTTNSLRDALSKPFDVWYHTRVQKERLKGEKINENDFQLTAEHMKRFPKEAVLMHPLPTAGEITPEIDKNPKAIYFTQSDNGVPVRMALLDWVLTSTA